MEYYSTIKKNEIKSFAAMVNRPMDCHNEWMKSDRKGEILFDIPYMWYLKKKNDTNEFTKQKQTHRLTEQIYNCWADGGKG